MIALIKLIVMLIWVVAMMLITTMPWLIQWESARRFCARVAFMGVNLIIGLKVKRRGDLSRHRPLILVSNHCSYLDIMVLGSQLPVAFTPKSEIRGWPIIGFCCKLAGCVFVERTPKAIARTKSEIAKRLASGRVMCLFAEGTTNDGTNLKPFKSSLFSLAEGEKVRVQPAAISYTHRDGEPLDRQGRAEIAWYDDMSLLPHLLKLLSARRIDAKLALLTPLQHTDDRKALCAESERVIKQAL